MTTELARCRAVLATVEQALDGVRSVLRAAKVDLEELLTRPDAEPAIVSDDEVAAFVADLRERI